MIDAKSIEQGIALSKSIHARSQAYIGNISYLLDKRASLDKEFLEEDTLIKNLLCLQESLIMIDALSLDLRKIFESQN